jgi:aminoglycoside phosphotransferase (APT) family kinase protein
MPRVRARDEDEPTPEGDEWVEYGGELIWAAGFTAGGVPYGLTVDEWRREMRSQAPSPPWVRARDVLETLVRLQSPSDGRIELGRVTNIGHGLYRRAFVAQVDVTPDANALSGAWVALLPRDDLDIDNDVLHAAPNRELRLLAILQAHPQLPFRTPRPLGALPSSSGTVLAREFLPGIPLDLRSGRQSTIRPWEVVATIAAAVHGIETQALQASATTRREHARSMLQSIERLPLPEARDAAAWAAEHLPPDEPATLLHGDLLGQNILIDPSNLRPFTVIDWEDASVGDPAFDLAIVTRGVRQPFQISGGLERLLEAYEAARGSQPRVTRTQVRFYELCLAARWCEEAAAHSSSEPLSEAVARLRRILTMAT